MRDYSDITTHGAYVGGRELPEHAIWRGIVARCRRTTAKCYPEYGGRGITLCERWLRYENFIADMGARPSPKHSVERGDNDGPYDPANCRWATHSEQQKNKRCTRRWEREGVSGTLVDWATLLGISKELAHWRMKHWGTFERGNAWRELQKGL